MFAHDSTLFGIVPDWGSRISVHNVSLHIVNLAFEFFPEVVDSELLHEGRELVGDLVQHLRTLEKTYHELTQFTSLCFARNAERSLLHSMVWSTHE